MSKERFFRCSLCHLPHDVETTLCPVFNVAIERPTQRPPFAGDRFEMPSTPPSAPIATAARGLIGTVVAGKYIVHRVLGRGGMATVYEAEQSSVGRPVALKVLNIGGVRGDTELKRFFREAKVAASLPHANICQIYDYGSLPDGSLYIAMERLEGRSLNEHIRDDGPLQVGEAVIIGVQALGALGFAHKRGVVHRDVKPENIFLGISGRNTVVKVLDFGLAKLIESTEDDSKPKEEITQLTRVGMTMGTPYYMAPEQALGDRNLDGRVDLWAVGVTLYEALTGRRPFEATGSYNLAKSILQQRHRPISDYRADVSPAMLSTIDRALTKERDLRYQTAAEFQRDLLAVLKLQTRKRE